MQIQERLFSLQDKAYADFQSRLVPTVPREAIIGVRVPQLRKLAKSCCKEEEISDFLQALPHRYYDENLFHSILISGIKEYAACIEAVEAFLPYVDNWAVCDMLSPKVFKKHRGSLLQKIKKWISSKETYTCRFGLGMLMSHYLDEDFAVACLEMAASVRSEEYYVNMMLAWFFATALAKQWEAGIVYLERERLDVWVHRKTIQKACESFRIPEERKRYLKTLKR